MERKLLSTALPAAALVLLPSFASARTEPNCYPPVSYRQAYSAGYFG